MTRQQKRNITEDDLTKLTGPKLIGDVLVLPINAFGSGQAHSNAGEEGNEEQLLWHHFYGWFGWKDAHDGKINREKELKEAAETLEAEKLAIEHGDPIDITTRLGHRQNKGQVAGLKRETFEKHSDRMLVH